MESFKEQWLALHHITPDATAFQGFDFNHAWWKLNQADGRLNILAFGSKKKLDFILPVCLNGKGEMKFLQSGLVDYLDILYNPDTNLHQVFSKIREYLEQNNEINKLVLNNIRSTSPLIHFLPAYFQKERFYCLQHDLYSKLPYTLMSGDKFLSHLRSSQVRGLKKVDKNLQTSAEIIEKGHSRFPTTIIETLIDRMVENDTREKEVYEPQLALMQEMYEQDAIFFIAQKDAGDQYVSITALVRLNPDTVMAWMSVYDPKIKMSNLKNYLHVIRYCHANHLNFDFGTGLYKYKLQNFSPEIGSLFSFYYYKKPLPFIYYFLRKTIAKALRII